MISGAATYSFGEYAEDVTRFFSAIKSSEVSDSGSIAVVDQGASQVAGYVDDPAMLPSVKGPYVVFGDHTRILKHVVKPFVIGAQGVRVLKPKDGIDSRFLHYALRSIELPSDGYARHFKHLKRVTLRIPSLSEQRRIVEILDRAEMIQRNRRRMISKLDELVDAQLEAVMLREEQDGKLRHTTIKDLCVKVTDGTHHSPKQADEGVPYVTATHIKPWMVNFDRAPSFVSQEDHEPIFSRCNPEEGDILYIKDGATTGIAAINRWNKPFSMLSSVALLKPDYQQVTPEYLCGLLNSRLIKQKWTSQMAGGAIRRLTLTKIKSFEVPVLSLSSQQQFATFAQNWWDMRTKLESASKHDQQLVDSLQSELLS